MYPALIAAAFITAVILNDIIQKASPMEIGKHFLFGFLAVLGLWALEARNMPIVAWGLLVVPTVVFLTSLVYVFLAPTPAPARPAPVPVISPPIPKPKEEPAIQLPDENTVCVELEFDPSRPKPNALPSCDVGLDGTVGMPGTVISAYPTNITSDLTTAAASPTEGSTTKTLDDLLNNMNTSLTPVTVCN